MKCIRCEHDCKYPERRNRKCPKCGGQFAFEPREGDLVSDAGFQHAINHVSASGSVRWGVEHLYYEICRRKRGLVPPMILIVVLFIVSLSCVLYLFANPGSVPAFVVALISLIAGVVALYARLNRHTVKVEAASFDGMWSRWCKTHGTPEGVIVRQPRPERPRQVEPDIGDYSFDRAVICDRARTVDLLLANNFHFENNCAVLSMEGYPPGPFQTVRAMLQRNPRLEVFALHDATPAGCKLARRLATDPEWFGGKVKVIDVGLRPSHAGRFDGLFRPSNALVSPGNGISDQEAAWLSKYYLELAVIRPEQVLKRLFRAINRHEAALQSTDSMGGGTNGGGDAASGGFIGDASSRDDADAVDADVDSFG